MKEDLALRVLSQIMSWDDERARREFAWLRLMSRLKYDGYRDFQAGMRFLESLSVWLQQFKPEQRETAYGFVRNTLTYVGPAELQRLVEQFYPRTVRDRLLSNEQLVIATQVDPDKWKNLLKKLRKELGDDTAQFKLVYLIDDFAGTGTSFFRYDEDDKKWTGKLMRFRDSLEIARRTVPEIFADGWQLCVHHYIASAAARDALTDRLTQAKTALAQSWWASDIHLSFGTVFPIDFPLVKGRDDAFIALTDSYYDPIIRTDHTDVGGVTHLGLGYGRCALPLVLEHNTPNNAVALLWAETSGGDREGLDKPAPAMRPLFRRRQRHS